MMRNLPVPVNEEDIDQMFEFADKDKDGRINYRLVMELNNEPTLCVLVLVNLRS